MARMRRAGYHSLAWRVDLAWKKGEPFDTSIIDDDLAPKYPQRNIDKIEEFNEEYRRDYVQD